MFRSIKVRLTVIICSILLLVFAVQMIVNFMFAGEFYLLQKMNLLREAYHDLTKEVQESDASISSIVQGLAVDRNLEFFLADHNMNLIYADGKYIDMEAEKADPKNKKPMEFEFNKYPLNYYKTTDPTLLRTDTMDGERIRLLGKVSRGDTDYYVAIRLSIQSFNQEMLNTNLFILYITAFGIVAGGITVYFVSRQFTKPIEEINQVAIHISELDFSVRAKRNRRKDEIGSLALNINRMADCLSDNIEHLKEANRKLELDNEFMNRIDEQRKELIANISHELKTPLAILTGYSEMLQNDIPGIDKAFYYETIQDETRKMNILIQNLLDLSNMENRLTELILNEIDPAEFAERIFRKYSPLLQKKEIRSEFTAQNCGTVSADEFYLEEAINNYLSNAIGHTTEGGLIRMTVELKADEAVISVFNEGDPIGDSETDKIWNSFYRVDKSRTRTSQNNVGLGLYIVRSVVNAHHGSCGVRNQENGVEFWLSLPKREGEDIIP